MPVVIWLNINMFCGCFLFRLRYFVIKRIFTSELFYGVSLFDFLMICATDKISQLPVQHSSCFPDVAVVETCQLGRG